MAELKSRADWRGGMGFDITAGEHSFIIDAPVKSGGKNEGPKPSYMLVAGLMACTGMDVASILEKMRVPLEKFHVETSTDVADNDPRIFRTIELIYHFDGPAGLDQHLAQIRKAIQLSKETYCCVSIMYSKFCPISLRAFVNGKEITLD